MASHIKCTIIVFSLIAVAGFALFYKLGAVPLADPDEPRYAESAREMIERGSYIVPYFNYEPRLQKPVLHYLLICASYKLLDVSEFSARLPSVLAALLVLFITFFFMQHFCGITAATLSCFIMGSSPLYFVPGRLTMPDIVFILAGRLWSVAPRTGGMRAFMFFRSLPHGPRGLWGFWCPLQLPCSACGSSGICAKSKPCVWAGAHCLCCSPRHLGMHTFISTSIRRPWLLCRRGKPWAGFSAPAVMILTRFIFIFLWPCRACYLGLF
jgi:hypothetical protein